MAKKFSILDYCQYLLSSQINYTITNLAEHIEGYSHDQINRYMRGQKLTPRILWQNVETSIVTDEAKYMYMLFDDTVLTNVMPSRLRWHKGNTVVMSMESCKGLG